MKVVEGRASRARSIELSSEALSMTTACASTGSDSRQVFKRPPEFQLTMTTEDLTRASYLAAIVRLETGMNAVEHGPVRALLFFLGSDRDHDVVRIDLKRELREVEAGGKAFQVMDRIEVA